MGRSNFDKFRDEIIYTRRNPSSDSNKIFEDLKRNSNIEAVLSPQDIVYRARIVSVQDDLCGCEPFMGFDEEGSVEPPPKLAKAYRANYDFIPYLYCTKDILTAVYEVRARICDQISIASIIPKRELMLLDFSTDNMALSGTKKTLFNNLGDWYSKPVNGTDNIFDYIPTQYITEFVRFELGYDGIKYKSAMHGGGINYVLFDSSSYSAVASKVYYVDELKK